MRRKDRAVTDINGIEEILLSCKTCHVAMSDGGAPYVVPLSYGYRFLDGGVLELYFHSAREGRKLDVLRKDSRACFEMSREGEAVQGDTPCGSGYYFASVIGFGEAVFLEDAAEKREALSVMFRHQAGRDVVFTDQQADGVCVFKVVSTDFTGKKKPRPDSALTTPVSAVKTFYPGSENVKPLGRTWLDGDDIRWCALSGSGIEFVISASKLVLTFAGDSGAKPDNKDGNARFAVYVNGERVIDGQIDGAEKSCVVFDTPTAAAVKIIKLSESANSVFGIKSLAAENCQSLKPADDKPLLIEFIGDSITCGYGVDDEVKEHHFSTSTEDVTKAYAYKTAEILNADYSMVSYSGYGVISGYSDDGRKSANQLVPKYYDKTGFSCGSANGRKPETVPWDFSVRQPGIIVINLGTNDNSYTKNDPEKCAEYQTEYTAFLKAVREKNPGAKIVCSLGVMGRELYPYMENAVSDYSRETGGGNISCFLFDVQDMAADGIAADWHPSERTHEKAARKLANHLSDMLND